MTIARSRALLFALLALVAAATPCAARAASQQEDVLVIAEHIPEAAQDARWFALPWPIDPLEAGRWQSGFVLGGADAAAAPYEVRGALGAFGASRALSERWALDLIGFVDRFSISGGAADQTLSAPFLDPAPLDLPARARFDRARGTVSHEGFGLGALRLVLSLAVVALALATARTGAPLLPSRRRARAGLRAALRSLQGKRISWSASFSSRLSSR